MTAATPLESVHKKGIFGDHHKKNEKDLMRISELEKQENSKIDVVKIYAQNDIY